MSISRVYGAYMCTCAGLCGNAQILRLHRTWAVCEGRVRMRAPCWTGLVLGGFEWHNCWRPVLLLMLLIYVRDDPEQPSAGRFACGLVLASHQGARCVGNLLLRAMHIGAYTLGRKS